MAAAHRCRRGTTLPILSTPEDAIQNSTRILHWLTAHRLYACVLPPAGRLREQAFALGEVFDRMGDAVLVRCYDAILDDPEAMLRAWTPDAGGWQPRMLRGLLPALRSGMRAWFRMDRAGWRQPTGAGVRAGALRPGPGRLAAPAGLRRGRDRGRARDGELCGSIGGSAETDAFGE